MRFYGNCFVTAAADLLQLIRHMSQHTAECDPINPSSAVHPCISPNHPRLQLILHFLRSATPEQWHSRALAFYSRRLDLAVVFPLTSAAYSGRPIAYTEPRKGHVAEIIFTARADVEFYVRT